MRYFLISALLLGLVSGCTSVNLGPHRIDVQQGNALDQENVARLKPGLNRSQVRFLLGTPLVVDPFRNDRWDYVYVFYKAGKLAEQKRITLFFDGEILARIEGDLPVVETPPAPPVKTGPEAETIAPRTAVEPLPASPAPKAEPIPAVRSPAPPPVKSAVVETSIVQPLPSPKNAPPYIAPRPATELGLQPETNVARIEPDVVPSFPESSSAAEKSDEPVLIALNAWANAWTRRDEAAFFAAYDDSFVPEGGGSRADWERRRRAAISAAQYIDLKIESPSIVRSEEGAVTATFNQFYRSDSYRDAVRKQLLVVARGDRWMIAGEKVLSALHGAGR